MSEELERQRRGVSLGELDPRKALDPAVKSMVDLQVRARLQAQQSTTVFIATVVSLVTSAFGFVAALAWNTAIQAVIDRAIKLGSLKLGATTAKVFYAVIVTLIAVLAVFIIRAIASRIAGRDLSAASEHF